MITVRTTHPGVPLQPHIMKAQKDKNNYMTSTQYTIKDNNTNNTHSFYSPSLGASVLINDDVFNNIRDEEIELRALELLSIFLDKYFG